jgi:hypothetical protein
MRPEGRLESYGELAARIVARPPAGGLRTRVVAVDGRGPAVAHDPATHYLRLR